MHYLRSIGDTGLLLSANSACYDNILNHYKASVFVKYLLFTLHIFLCEVMLEITQQLIFC